MLTTTKYLPGESENNRIRPNKNKKHGKAKNTFPLCHWQPNNWYTNIDEYGCGSTANGNY